MESSKGGPTGKCNQACTLIPKVTVERGKQAQEASVQSPACNLAQTTEQSIYADIKPKPTKVTGSHNQNQSQLTIQAVRQLGYSQLCTSPDPPTLKR